MKVFNKRKPLSGRGFGALTLIAALMLGSGAVRLGMEAGPAIAREFAPERQDQFSLNQSLQVPRPSSEDLHQMLNAFQQRERTIKEKEIEIEDRMKVLSVAEEAIRRQMQALIEAEERLRTTLSLADGATETDLAKLTTVYEKMKPKETAALFEEMDPEFAAGFLARMRPDIAAGIMAGLSPKVAYTISVVLASRNASVPKN